MCLLRKKIVFPVSFYKFQNPTQSQFQKPRGHLLLKDLWHAERSRMQTECREMKTALPRRRCAQFLDGKLNKLPYSCSAQLHFYNQNLLPVAGVMQSPGNNVNLVSAQWYVPPWCSSHGQEIFNWSQ